MTEYINPLSKCPFFFSEPSVAESLALPGWLNGVKPEPDSRCRYRRDFIQEAGGEKKKGLFAQARHPNPLNSYAVLSSPSSPPTGLLSEAPRKMGHISKNTMMRGVSECLLTSYQSLHLDLFNPSFYLRPSVLNQRIIPIH